MSDVTHTDVWKKQLRTLPIAATNEQIRMLEAQGKLVEGKLSLGELYVSVLAEVSAHTWANLEVMAEAINKQHDEIQSLKTTRTWFTWALLFLEVAIALILWRLMK